MQEKVTKPTKRIKQISVIGLFGMFDHVIPLNVDERITIIHGLNGFGKTTILKLLKALFSQSNLMLRTVPFNELRVDFNDDTSLWVTKTLQPYSLTSDEEESANQQIIFRTSENYEFPLSSKHSLSSSQLLSIERAIPSLDRIGVETWRNISTGEVFSLEEIIERFSDRLPAEIASEKMPEWLVTIRKSIPIRFIETERLSVQVKSTRRIPYDRQSEPTLALYSKHLYDFTTTKLAEYGTLSQSLDSAFPVKLVRPNAQYRDTTEEELRTKLDQLEKKRVHLTTTGILDQDPNPAVPIDKIDDSTKIVLAVYADDTEKKLSVLDDLANKIDLLKEIINNRFTYKTLVVNRENDNKALVFISRNGDNLEYTALSSGEQHELILIYELLFLATPGSLVLVDEPEISLHVGWQLKFLEDLQHITQLVGLDALIATHSPDIIKDRWDLTVRLEGPEE